MRSIFIVILLLPVFGYAQIKKSAEAKPKIQTVAFDGYVITGMVNGFADGTPVSFLNEQTNVPEQQSIISKGKFIIKGKMTQPGFKGLIFNNSQPVVPLFLDNSNVKITGKKDALDKLVIIGSPSHTQFKIYTDAIKPYEQFLLPDAMYDSIALNKVAGISEGFVKKYPASFVSPLAIIRFYQATQNGVRTDELFKLLPSSIQLSSLGNYVTQLIAESKINPIGSVVSDFTQTDTAGIAVNLSSLKGKYVLIDFWASWCRPCRQENPNVVAAFEKFKNKNFTILGVSLDQNKKAWVDAIKMDGLAWSHVSDLKGWSNQVAAIFKVTSIPQNLLLDPEGKIIAKNLRGAVLKNKLNALLK
ncbi:MAG TPA: TlpA disulfide reductase family protein [Chitinophagaceae bacterium]|nr:TlpA disulfide reductase family protein [Chitinophagaceae bacterium]